MLERDRNPAWLGRLAETTTMTVPLQQELLREWLSPRYGDVDGVTVDSRRQLLGGQVSPSVERVHLTASIHSGATHQIQVVAKRAQANEMAALQRIHSIPGTTTFPELIGCGTDDSGPWIVTPYYCGAVSHRDAEPPAAVYADLARLHAEFLGETEALPDEFVRIDSAWCAAALTDFAASGVRSANELAPHPIYAKALSMLHDWAADRRMLVGTELFPPTLLHADVHALNVIIPNHAGDQPRLIDWGSSRIGPAMLDVALASDAHSAGASAYVRTWSALTGHATASWEIDAGHAWAKAFSNAMFLGAAAQFAGPTAVGEALDAAGTALDHFGRLID
jgi:aminoglycoside phosphotransferase (APT) family kinase protein